MDFKIYPEPKVWAAVTGLAPQSWIFPNRVWCILTSPFVCALVEVVGSCSDVVWSPGCVCFGVPWDGIQCRSMSGAISDGNCLELQSDLQFVAVSYRPGYVWQDQSCLELRGRSAKSPSLPQYLLSLVNCLWASVTEIFSGSMWVAEGRLFQWVTRYG